MQRLNLLFALFLFFGFLGCDTESNIKNPNDSYFVKYFGGDGNQSGVDMLALSDGNFLLLGNTQFNGAKSIYLIKVTPTGELIWETTFEGSNETAVDIEETNNGNFVVAAQVDNSADDSDVKLILVSADGAELQSQVYGTTGGKKDMPKSVTPLRDGGFIVTGVTVADTSTRTDVNPDLFSNIFHFRCNASLVFDNSNWYELYGATEQIDGAVKTFQDATDNFYVFGYSDQKIKDGQQEGNVSQLYYRIGNGGTADSEVGIIGDLNEYIKPASVYKVEPALGGGYLVVGTFLNSDGTSSLHASKLKENLQFNSNDQPLNERLSIPTSSIEGVTGTMSLTSPQGFLLLGEEQRSLGTKNLSLSKIDQIGDLIWTVSLGSEEENDEAASVIETTDGKILVLGTVELGNNQTKMALFKLNSTGRLHE